MLKLFTVLLTVFIYGFIIFDLVSFVRAYVADIEHKTKLIE